MKIDISRVNFLEKDVEEWLFHNPEVIPPRFGIGDNRIERWIGRQYLLPSGIADLVGIREDKKVVVVEVKNVAINKAAVLQVCRYHNDLQHILSSRMEYPHVTDSGEPLVDMILIGPGIDDQTFGEAQAVGVEVLTFSVNFELDLAALGWTRDHREKVTEQQEAIAEQPEWDIFGMTVSEHIYQLDVEKARASQTDFAIEQVFDDYDQLLNAITKHPDESDDQ